MLRSRWMVLALGLTACSPDAVLLAVDLKSDYVPGAEVFEVRVSLPDEERELPPVEIDRDSALADPGIRILEIPDLSPALSRRVRVAAVDIGGEEIGAEEVIVENLNDRAVTLVLTRDCRDVTCPGAGAATATRCLGERCVAPSCLTGNEPECPDAECSVDADCTPGDGCSAARCVEGTCLDVEDPTACATSEFCDPDIGCRGTPMPLEGRDCGPATAHVPVPACTTDCALRVETASASDSHTCVVDMAGAVYCFGPSPGIGAGDAYGRLRPVQVSLPGPAAEVAAGSGFSCALLADGDIYCWGENDRGALGLGDLESRYAPTDPVAGGPWTTVATRYDTVCAIDAAGLLFCWGHNPEGQVGDGSAGDPVTTPRQVNDSLWAAVGPGQGHTCAIRADGTLWCWGRNTSSQLGQPEGAPGQRRSPVQVGTDTDWLTVSQGQAGGCALKADSTLWCWGQQNYGSFALGVTGDGIYYEPTQRPDGMDWTDVSVELFHGCGLRDTELYCWGRAIEGQLGIRQDDPQLTPVAVTPGVPASRIATGRFTSFVIRDDGAVLGAGANCGMMGNGERGPVREFTELTF